MKKIVSFLIILIAFTAANAQVQFNYLGTWDNQGVPDYLVEPGDEISQDLLDRIHASLPDGQRVPIHHPEYLAEGTQTNILLLEQADVFVTFVTEGAGYKNVLGFYYYDVNDPPETVADIQSTMTVIYPNVSKLYSGGGLLPGDKVKIGNFPANTVIGWFLAANGYQNNNPTNGHWLLFSNPDLNPESDTTLQQHNVLLNDLGSGRVILGFEDIKRDYGSCDHDFEDALFYVTSTPTEAISYDDIPVIDDPNPGNRADLSLTKTADNLTPLDGEAVKFTLTLTNNGPYDATGVEIGDVIPEGLIYSSHTASQGTFDPDSGKWTIDLLSDGAEATLVITTIVDLITISQSAFDIGPAEGFNVMLWHEISQPSSDTEGKLYAGINAYLSSYSVGDRLPDSGGEEDVLVVGYNLTFLSGTVTGGNVVYGRGTNLPEQQVSILNGDLRQEMPIHFFEVYRHFYTLSNALKNYETNGTTTWQNMGLTLSGSDPFLNVFEVSGDQLSEATSFTLSVPNGAVALINVDGYMIDWGGALNIFGTAVSNVLFNFHMARTIKIEGISVRGSILAPMAQLEFPSGEINGQVMARAAYGTGQFNIGENGTEYLFRGNIPVSENITNSAEILSFDQLDPDSSNNNDEVLITLAGFHDPGNTGNENWELVGNFQSGEIVWVMKEDKEGNLLAGTWGGKISRSTDSGETWARINTSMNVGFVWDIEVDEELIFAGTEMGVYKSTNNGADWEATALTGKDVRALVKTGGNLFAGTWGESIFKSTDNGETWTASRDLANLPVHALEANSSGDIFAGTFGYGVIRSTDSGDSWEELETGYDFVWTLGITDADIIYAGTYGGGIYRSGDDGDSWYPSNANLGATHIYSIQIDGAGNVFCSGWGAGVYALQTTGAREDSWGSLGMNGLNVSSLYTDPVTGKLYAGTDDGLLYVNNDPLTGLKEIEETDLPLEYNLEQNYPNPFNPSTRIKFTVAESGAYKLAIYDALGREVAELVNGELNSGSYEYTFSGENLSSGIYFYRLSGDNYTATRKMLLIK